MDIFNICSNMSESVCEIIIGNTLDTVRNFEDGKFDLIITSPPYNVGKKYETKKSIEQYLAQKEKGYVEIAKDRINRFREGVLKIRPMNKPIHQPTPNEKTAKVPDEWLFAVKA